MTCFVMAAGGTGGHVFPALAVADELRRQGGEVQWLAAGGMETRVVPERGFALHLVPFSPPRGLAGGFRLAKAAWRARNVLRSLHPAAVLATGGYACAPGGLAAKMLGAPLIVYEQNAVCGRANKLLCKIARRVCTGFPDSVAGAKWTGNPARDEFFLQPPPQQRFSDSPNESNLQNATQNANLRARRLLILGGSQGARVLNVRVPESLAKLPDEFSVLHQCGQGNGGDTVRAYQTAGRRAEVREFLDDVAAQMAAADLVICRAGAATLAELAAVGAAALLVPYPFAAGGHQKFNAAFWRRRDAAFVCAEKDLNAEWLANFLRNTGKNDLRQTALRAKTLARPDAAKDVAAVCIAEAKNAA